MTDPDVLQIEDYRSVARQILLNSANLAPGERVTILGRADSLPFCEALELECKRLNALPLIVVGSDAALLAALNDPEITAAALAHTPPQLLALIEHSDLVISTFFDRADPARFARIIPERLAALRQSEVASTDLIYDGTRRWLGTEFPTPAQAARLGCDFELLNTIFWNALRQNYAPIGQQAQKLAARLKIARQLRLCDAAGTTDLLLGIATGGRPVICDDGVLSQPGDSSRPPFLNLPSGEVCFAPPETTAEGYALIRQASHNGQPINNLRLHFEHGKATPISADSGLEVFTAALALAGENAHYLGEFGIGLNPAVTAVTGMTLLDEKILGACHLALGENRPLGGTINSPLHWDLVVQEAVLYLDGEVILKDGKLWL